MGLLFNPRVLFGGFGGDGGRGLNRILFLHVGGSGGDGAPCFATGHAESNSGAGQQGCDQRLNNTLAFVSCQGIVKLLNC